MAKQHKIHHPEPPEDGKNTIIRHRYFAAHGHIGEIKDGDEKTVEAEIKKGNDRMAIVYGDPDKNKKQGDGLFSIHRPSGAWFVVFDKDDLENEDGLKLTVRIKNHDPVDVSFDLKHQQMRKPKGKKRR